jgi:hypothetical protein
MNIKRTIAVIALLFGAGTGFVIGNVNSKPRLATAQESVATEASQANTTHIGRKTGSQLHFLWGTVANDDIQQYIANLRGIDCPEPVIADIIRNLITADYQARVNHIFDPLAQYWSSAAEQKSIDAQIKAIRKERDGLLGSLGLDVDNTKGLTPEKQKSIAEATKLYPKVPPPPGTDHDGWLPYLEARKARIDYLSKTLTPDELLSYRMSQDGNAKGVGSLLRDINPTPEEQSKVFSAIDGDNLNRTNGLLLPGSEAKLKETLGADRYAQYQAALSPGNILFNSFTDTHGLTDDQIQQLKELRNTAGASAVAPGMAGFQNANPETPEQAQYRQGVTDILKSKQLVDSYFRNPLIYIKPKQ